MNSTYIAIIFMWIVVFCIILPRKKAVNIIAIRKNKKNKDEVKQMLELAKQFIGQKVIVYIVTSLGTQYCGILKEVTQNALLLEVGNELEIINAEYIAKIRQYPKNKKGKDKSIVLD